MKFQSLPIAALLVCIASAYTGDMTYYSPGLGSCGRTSSGSDAVVALSVQMMANGANPNANPKFGTTISITNPHTARIVDTCQACAYEDIDVSPSVFEAVDPNGLADGRIKVNWG